MTNIITDETYPTFLANTGKDQLSLLYFWGPGCSPCKQLSPKVDKLASENPEVNIGKINAEENTKTALEHNVLSLPVIIAFRNGKKVAEARQNIKDKQLDMLLNAPMTADEG